MTAAACWCRIKMADGKTLHYSYDERGNVSQFTDEAGEITRYTYDSLGRQQRTDYADGSSEETVYEPPTGAVFSRRDRANQWFTYIYDSGGRTLAVGAGKDLESPVILRYDYDAAGRLTRVRNADAGIAWSGYDRVGRPTTTKTYRYAPGTGLASTPEVIDVHTQTHSWSVYDERTNWRLPAAGENPGAASGSLWLQQIAESYDGAGNLTQLRADSVTLLSATSRSMERLASRTRTTGRGATLATSYGFADGTSPAVALPNGSTAAASGLPLWSATALGSTTIAGTSNSRDAALRLDATRELGLGNRASSW
jgi:YD repeat-containing protein